MSKKQSLLLPLLLFLSSCGLVKERPPAPNTAGGEQSQTEREAKAKAAEFFNKLGLAAMAEANYAKAIANFKRATEVDPTDPELWKNLGEAYMAAHFYEKAEEAFHRALELKRDYGEVMFDLGLLYENWNKLREALKWYKKAAELDTYDERYRAYFRLAQVYKKLGDIKNYEENLKKAIYLYPAYGEAILELARHYAKRGTYPSAESYYRLYISQFPNDWNVKLEFVDLLVKEGKFKEAKLLLKEIIDNCQNPDIVKRAYEKVNQILIMEAQRRLKTQKP